MLCNECRKECKYKAGIACDNCKYKELPLTGVCQNCVDGECKFKEAK